MSTVYETSSSTPEKLGLLALTAAIVIGNVSLFSSINQYLVL
jgi:hypothetical protein